MSATKRALEDAHEAQSRPRRRRTSVSPEPQQEASPECHGAAAQSPSSQSDELSTGVTGHEQLEDKPASVEELQDEIEGLEAVVDQLDAEKHALKMRLSEVENTRKFNPGHCKKWLVNNFEFDRKDTPELLARIFESYLMQNDTIEPLPHQLIVKNSARGQARRDKIAIARFNMYQRHEKDKIPVAETKPRKATRPSPQDGGAPNGTDAGTYGQFLYVSPDAIEDLYATKPWTLFTQHWPKLRPAGKQASYDALVRLQDDFLTKNVVAIWERTHWFPIKMENGKTALEIKLLGRHHNRRKRRQAQLKERLESLTVELKSQFEKALLDQSIFGNRWVGTILRRPTLWIPRENEPLLDQLRELDKAEPERNYHFSS